MLEPDKSLFDTWTLKRGATIQELMRAGSYGPALYAMLARRDVPSGGKVIWLALLHYLYRLRQATDWFRPPIDNIMGRSGLSKNQVMHWIRWLHDHHFMECLAIKGQRYWMRFAPVEDWPALDTTPYRKSSFTKNGPAQSAEPDPWTGPVQPTEDEPDTVPATEVMHVEPPIRSAEPDPSTGLVASAQAKGPDPSTGPVTRSVHGSGPGGQPDPPMGPLRPRENDSDMLRATELTDAASRARVDLITKGNNDKGKEKILRQAGDCDPAVILMLRAEGISAKRANELASCPKATLEVVEGIITRCHARKPKPRRNLTGYIAEAVANEIEPETVQAVRKVKRAVRGPSNAVKGVQLDKAAEAAAAAGDLERTVGQRIAAELNTGRLKDIGGFQVGRGGGCTWACGDFLLIFSKHAANDGAAVSAFKHGKRELSELPGVLAVVSIAEVLSKEATA